MHMLIKFETKFKTLQDKTNKLMYMPADSSILAAALSDQSSWCAQYIAEVIRLIYAQADQSICWIGLSVCLFCYGTAFFRILK